jgi:hypothetical protein
MAENPDFEKWKDSGMVFNRYRQVVTHRKLMKMVEDDNLDMDGVRTVLKELIRAAMPVSNLELVVIKDIENPAVHDEPATGPSM